METIKSCFIVTLDLGTTVTTIIWFSLLYCKSFKLTLTKIRLHSLRQDNLPYHRLLALCQAKTPRNEVRNREIAPSTYKSYNINFCDEKINKLSITPCAHLNQKGYIPKTCKQNPDITLKSMPSTIRYLLLS